MAMLPQVFCRGGFFKGRATSISIDTQAASKAENTSNLHVSRLATVEHVELVLSNEEANLSAVELAAHVYASPRCVTIPLEFEDAPQGIGCEVP